MKFSLYCLLFFTVHTIFAQKRPVLANEDYLNLQNKVRLYTNSNIDSAFFFANKIEASANLMHQTFALAAKSYLYQLKGDSSNSKLFFRNASERLTHIPISKEKKQLNSYLLNYGGLSDWKRGDFNLALEKYQQGKNISLGIDDQVQFFKFNGNIALVNSEIGNYKSSITVTKESERFLDNNRHLFNEEMYSLSKSNNNINLAIYYQKYYLLDKSKTFLLDSAFYYYEKTLSYSDKVLFNKVKAQNSIGNVYFFKKKYIAAEKAFQNALIVSKENDLQMEYSNAANNLGYLYYTTQDYDKALPYFNKIDSIYKTSESNILEYINSNYYQAKIYDANGDFEKSAYHAKIFLDNFEKNERDLNTEILEINYKKGVTDLKKEMVSLQKENDNRSLLRNGLVAFFGVLLVGMIILYFKTNHNRKEAEKKIELIIAEHLKQSEQKVVTPSKEQNFTPSEIEKPKAEVSISEENEREIMIKLKSLEDKQFYLKSDFTQQEVAKKIKTNTTYLSYVVNKNYNKSFSVYYNELRINYVIDEIINNSKYRAYTTQAIAESAGFKNADSFANSFKKKTGVTPYQFIKEITKRELI